MTYPDTSRRKVSKTAPATASACTAVAVATAAAACIAVARLGFLASNSSMSNRFLVYFLQIPLTFSPFFCSFFDRTLFTCLLSHDRCNLWWTQCTPWLTQLMMFEKRSAEGEEAFVQSSRNSMEVSSTKLYSTSHLLVSSLPFCIAYFYRNRGAVSLERENASLRRPHGRTHIISKFRFQI